YATRAPQHGVSGGGPAPIGAPPTATDPGAGVLAGVSGTKTATGPVPKGSPSMTITPTPTAPATSPAMPTSPAATTGTAVVTVSVTATPASGTCSTDVVFVAHFTLNVTGKYRWHWVFGGANDYSSASGDHDQDKTGDVRLTKKFDTGVSGTYWGQV